MEVEKGGDHPFRTSDNGIDQNGKPVTDY